MKTLTQEQKLAVILVAFGEATADATKGDNYVDTMYPIAVNSLRTDHLESQVELEPLAKGDKIVLNNAAENREIIFSVCAGTSFRESVERYENNPWGWFTMHATDIDWQQPGKVIRNGKLDDLEAMEDYIRFNVAIKGYTLVSHERNEVR